MSPPAFDFLQARPPRLKSKFARLAEIPSKYLFLLVKIGMTPIPLAAVNQARRDGTRFLCSVTQSHSIF
jgi:hypothetical protein